MVRNPKSEMTMLNRLNCHIDKFDELFKNFDQDFIDKNKYPDMLPFKFNRVKINKHARPNESRVHEHLPVFKESSHDDSDS